MSEVVLFEIASWVLVAEVCWWLAVGYLGWSLNRFYKQIREIPVEYK